MIRFKQKHIWIKKGYMVGNAVTDPIFDENAFIPFVHGMGLISDQMFKVKIWPTDIALSFCISPRTTL